MTDAETASYAAIRPEEIPELQRRPPQRPQPRARRRPVSLPGPSHTLRVRLNVPRASEARAPSRCLARA
eukprot:391543-Rhodomonas_salina.2